MENVLRLGTRGSLLARTQSGLVADELMRRHPGLRVELCIMKTTGDQVADRPLAEVGGKGLFTKELEQALLANEVDFAVHSFKDVPVTMPLVDVGDLIMAAVPKRVDPRDVLVSDRATRIAELPKDGKVGTGSLRRRCQILAIRPDLKIELVRGNIDTRLRKVLQDRMYDGIILAMAGLQRTALFNEKQMHPVDPSEMLPAAAQGALAIQCRRDDARTRGLLSVLDDPATHACVELERSLVLKLEGDCYSPIAVLAEASGENVRIRAAVGARGGELPVVRAEASGKLDAGAAVVDRVFDLLAQQDARKLLGNAR